MSCMLVVLEIFVNLEVNQVTFSTIPYVAIATVIIEGIIATPDRF